MSRDVEEPTRPPVVITHRCESLAWCLLPQDDSQPVRSIQEATESISGR